MGWNEVCMGQRENHLPFRLSRAPLDGLLSLTMEAWRERNNTAPDFAAAHGPCGMLVLLHT